MVQIRRGYALTIAAALTVVGCSVPADSNDAPGGQATATADTDDPAEAPAADDGAAADTAADAAVMDFVRSHAREAGDTGETPSRVAIAHIPDSHLSLAYVTGPFWCGSGGCTLLVIRENAFDVELVGDVSVARAPIRVLNTQTNAMPDLGVHVSGGGLPEGYEALLAFDGTRYPDNPTVAPARRVDNAEGTVLIAEDDEGVPLD